MKSIFEKLTSNADVVKNIKFDAINRALHNVTEAEKRSFQHSLKLSVLMTEANEFFISKECKGILLNIGQPDMKKEDFFKHLFGFERSMTFRLIKVGKLVKTSPEIVESYVNGNVKQSLIELLKFANVSDKESSDAVMNTTAEGITEKTETEKPKKFTTTKKGIDIRINSGVTAEDIAQAIEYLKGLQA